MTVPVAAIEALIALLKHTTSSTVMETLEITNAHINTLLEAAPNQVPVKAGADLFKQFLKRSLKQTTGSDGQDMTPNDSFNNTRNLLIEKSQALCTRVKASRTAIAESELRGSSLYIPL